MSDKKTVKVNESELITMINDLVETELKKSKVAWLSEEKTKWIKEQKETDKVAILESKLQALESKISKLK